MPAIVPDELCSVIARPRTAATRSSASSSSAPAQCSAESSPRLWPTATVGLDAERGQDAQPGERAGDDPRLGDLGGDHVAGGRQRGLAVDLVDLGEPAAQGAAAGAACRSPGRGTGSRCGPGRWRGRGSCGRPSDDHGGLAGLERLAHAAQALHGVLRRGHHDGGPVGQVAQLAVQGGGQVGQLRVREPGDEADQLAPAAPAAPAAVRASSEQQLDVLGRAGQGPGAGVQRPAPLGRGVLEHDVGVDAAEAHRGDAGAHRCARRPRLGLAQHAQRRRLFGEHLVRVDAADAPAAAPPGAPPSSP